MPRTEERHSPLTLLALVIAGEMVFMLPFVIPRVFRPTMLDVFGLNNFQIGTAFSAYGAVAMVSYFFGGPLADRFSARRLITASLLATAAGGVLFTQVPGQATLAVLYGFWGLSTILLFWAPLIRATRVWGGSDLQGRGYGLLDGGRGLVAAALGSVSVTVFALLLPEQVDGATDAQRESAFRAVIWISIAGLVASAALAWFAIPERSGNGSTRERATLDGVLEALRRPTIWLLALVILCAYVAYKSTDFFSLYARDVLGYDESEAATVGAISLWLRPISAVAAGWLADRIDATRVICAAFLISALGCLALAAQLPLMQLPAMFIVIVAATSAGFFALRAVYFAVLAETRVPLAITGSAVGVVSVVGFTPDVFAGPLFGYLLDSKPGAGGHTDAFVLVAAVAGTGFLLTLLLRRLNR